ncbi:apolipoprotein N-acyltransferase [uncultured Rhodoblastus sp.]|uniref:apolipoprotein N-acyltransferase n=1 Tax=uncultured Rhodoblastus sp. TaxID=543037 RepID=UPI0025F97909|nr:apolipoprotein N-acyltransferase [uncultured Rhodoblastus sp.]
MVSIAQRILLADFWPRRLIAFGGGAFGALALPPFGFFPAFFVPMVLAVWLIDGSGAETAWASLRRAAGAGWWMGFGYFIAGLCWLGAAFLVEAERFAWALPLGVVGLPAGLALFTALGFGLSRLMWSSGAARISALAAGLTAAEWLRGHVLTGFPWNDFGMVLGGNLILAQTASICGLYGLTLLSALLFAAPALLGDVRPNRRFVGASALALAGLAVFGLWRLQQTPGEVQNVRLRIVQPNVPLDQFRADRGDDLLELYLSLSDRATSPRTSGVSDVTHVIWPESAFPFILSRDPAALALIGARLQKAVLFTGAARVEGVGRQASYFNAVEVIAGGEVRETYDKMHLAPFGEYLPFAHWLAQAGITQFVAIPGGFESGASTRLLNAPGLPPVFPMVCYESIFPDEIADRLQAEAVRPGLMLNVTNDGWFGATPGPYQHFAQARLRTIEQGLPMARAANTGISAIIDPFGRIVASAPLGVEAVIDGNLPGSLPPTLFSRHSRTFPMILWILAFIGAYIRPRSI